MGNSASLPSLESNGRPFGTERSPIFSLGRHVDGQTRTEGPVARLERTPGAGGRRRARKQEQESSQRDQNGKRPEEARSERKADSDPSRRSTESKARERSGSETPMQGRPGDPGSPSVQSESGTSTGKSFESHLAFQEVRPEFAKAAGAQKQTKGAALDPMMALAASQAPAALVQKAPVTSTHNSPVAGTGSNQLGSPKAGNMAALAAPAPANVGGTKEPKETKVASVPAAVSPPELSEAQEAQRTSQVLRQLRMQLHPGLRSATVHLHPAELGRLQIKIRTSAGEVRGEIHADNEETLAVLERHIPELEAAFADQGFEEMSFEFVLDKQDSRDPGAWNFDRDVSAELESRLEQQGSPDSRAKNLLSDLGVDTYA